MDKAKLIILKSEIENQANTIEDIYKKIAAREHDFTVDLVKRESLAYQLHNLYCAFEDLFKTIASFFENQITDTLTYHSQLLKRMTFNIEGVRPALLDKETFVLLDTLRAFRHFFRHAYSYELDPKKLALVLEAALKLKSLYRQQIDYFLQQLLKEQ